jgi:hypothetical protein
MVAGKKHPGGCQVATGMGKEGTRFYALESELDGELRLPRITHALPEEAIKVEQEIRNSRVNVVFIVKGIERQLRRKIFARIRKKRCI